VQLTWSCDGSQWYIRCGEVWNRGRGDWADRHHRGNHRTTPAVALACLRVSPETFSGSVPLLTILNALIELEPKARRA
jgi:hypothetical protein